MGIDYIILDAEMEYIDIQKFTTNFNEVKNNADTLKDLISSILDWGMIDDPTIRTRVTTELLKSPNTIISILFDGATENKISRSDLYANAKTYALDTVGITTAEFNNDIPVATQTSDLSTTAPDVTDNNFLAYQGTALAKLRDGQLTPEELYNYLSPSNLKRQEKADKITQILKTLNITDTITGIDRNGTDSNGFLNIERDEHRSIEDIINILASKSVFDIVDILNNGNKDNKPNTPINNATAVTGIKERLLTDNYKNITPV